MKHLVMLMLLPFAAMAEEARPLSPAEFEAMAVGHTLHFSYGDRYFGAETFVPNRKTLWRSADGECQRGIWTAETPQVHGSVFCFAYESGTTPCWTAEKRGDTVFVTSMETGGELSISTINNQPLECRQSAPTS